MNILALNLATRKIRANKLYNPSAYFILDILKHLSYKHKVYNFPFSIEATDYLIPYSNQSVDLALVLGCEYRYVVQFESFKKLILPQFEELKKLYSQKVPIVMLSWDIQNEPKLIEDITNIKFSRHIDELEMSTQPTYFYYADKIIKESLFSSDKTVIFSFAGNIKNRRKMFRDIFEKFDFSFYLLGAGWDKIIKNKQAIIKGTQNYLDTVNLLNKTKYSVIIPGVKDSIERNWITGRYFENIACDIISFVHSDYDKKEEVIKGNDFRRFSNGQEVVEKIKLLEKDKEEYNKILSKQRLEIKNNFYSLDSFLLKIDKLLNL